MIGIETPMTIPMIVLAFGSVFGGGLLGKAQYNRAKAEAMRLVKLDETRAELAQKTGMMTFPQILIGDELVGGFDELSAADKSGRLAELTAA